MPLGQNETKFKIRRGKLMNWFKNRKTVTKLMIGFGVLAAMLAFVSLSGISTAPRISTRS